MGRVLKLIRHRSRGPWSGRLWRGVVLGLAPCLCAAEQPDRYELRTGVDLSYVYTDGNMSWTNGSVGKLRYDDGSDGLTVSRAFVDYSLRLTDTVAAKMAMELYDDDLGSPVDLTQAYLEWRPVPVTANRYRLKIGAFYPRISLENSGPSWASPYTLSSSAINTWVAEELRTFGAELSVSRRPQRFGGSHSLSLQAAVFWNNDPAGSLLAWKGWSAHDRQSRFGDHLPLPPLPQMAPGGAFEMQDPFVAPFTEVDKRAGYYINGEWKFASRILLRAMHYDNRADPTSLRGGQYGWTTAFNHLATQISLPGDLGLIAQWMRGSTVMGPRVNGAHIVDVEFDSAFALLTRAFGKHRLSARYDHFEVSQNDRTPEDNNPEYGHAWTLAYQFAMNEHASLAAEWIKIRTHHCGWVYYGLPPDARERQLTVSLRLRFGT